MRLLTLDTSTEACSAALWIDGETINRYEYAPRRHTELILPMLDALLAEAQMTPQMLDALAFGRGPGSFTGIRIGCGVAQGVAFAADIPILPISSLAALAQAAWQQWGWEQALATIDARMQEVYWGYYSVQEGVMVLQGEEHVSPPNNVMAQGWKGIGSGADLLSDLFIKETEHYPHAEMLIPLALAAWKRDEAVGAEQAMPVYLRNQVV